MDTNEGGTNYILHGLGRTYFRASEPLKRQQTQEANNLLRVTLGLGLATRTSFFRPTTPFRKKGKGKKTKNKTVSGICFFKIPVTIDPGQPPTKSVLFSTYQRWPTFQEYIWHVKKLNWRQNFDHSMVLWTVDFSNSFVTCQHSRWTQHSILKNSGQERRQTSAVTT